MPNTSPETSSLTPTGDLHHHKVKEMALHSLSKWVIPLVQALVQVRVQIRILTVTITAQDLTTINIHQTKSKINLTINLLNLINSSINNSTIHIINNRHRHHHHHNNNVHLLTNTELHIMGTSQWHHHKAMDPHLVETR